MKSIDGVFELLNIKEKKVLMSILEDLAKGNTTSYQALIDVDYREQPVSPAIFLDDEYYFQHIGKSMYPKWREHFIDIYSGSKSIYHVILTGSIGCGKDYFAEVCLAYELYKVGCLKDPHKYFELSLNSDIVFALVSITKQQAKNVIFTDFKNMIDASPWFKDKFRRNMDKNDMIEIKSPADVTEFSEMGKIVVMYGAPNNTSVIGANVLTAVIDEANFMEVIQKSKRSRGVNQEYNQAQSLYNNILRRQQSRYLKDGKIPGKLFLISSRQYPDDFVEKKIKELRDDPCVVIYEHTKYEMKPDQFSDVKFKVEVGDERFPPRILKSGDVPRVGAEVLEVPEDFLMDFERDIEGSIRDIAGRPALSTKNFIGHRDKLLDCVKTTVPILYTGYTTTLTDGHKIREDILKDIDLTIPRTIHLDMSTTKDATGIAMVHVSSMKRVERLTEDQDGQTKKVYEYLPIFRTDLIIQVVPAPNAEIPQSQIRMLIYRLRDLGFNIVCVSADKYQSKGLLQTLKENQFRTEELSVDLSLEPYYNLRDAIYEGRFETFHHPVFHTEMVHLEEDTKKRKIDHPPAGEGSHKDCSDAVAGAVQSLINLGISSTVLEGKQMPSHGLMEELAKSESRESDMLDFDIEVYKETYNVKNINEDTLRGLIGRR